MISNFIVATLILVAMILIVTFFITLGENTDWFLVRLLIGAGAPMLGGIVAIMCDVGETNLLEALKADIQRK